jgi:glycosyltransferase 2 family protein
MTRRRHAVVAALFGLAISALFGYIALHKISLDEVRTSLSDADYVWLAPCIALTLAIGWLRAIRWRLLFKHREAISLGQSFSGISVGLMFNSVLPARAGEVPRVLAVRRATGISAFEIGATIVVERILDVFALAMTALVIWPWLPDKTWINLLCLFSLGVVVGFAILVVSLALFREQLPRMLLWVLHKLPFISEHRAIRVHRALVAGAAILVRPSRLLEALLFSAVIWIASGLAIWALFPAFGLDTSGFAPWLVLVANAFAIAIPAGPAGVGVFEASVQAALVAYGVNASTALSYAIVLHAVNFFPVILVGLVCSWWLGRHPAHARFQPEPA